MSYSLDPQRPRPYVVIDYFDAIGREGVYSGSFEDCQAFISEQPDADISGMYDIIKNPHYDR